MDKITESNWEAHKSIDGCLFALMIIYFHLAKIKDKKGEEKSALPWLVARMRAEIDGHMVNEQDTFSNLGESSSSSESDTFEIEVYSSSESEIEEDSEEPKRKQPTRTAKKVQSKKRKQVVEIRLLNKLNPMMGYGYAFWATATLFGVIPIRPLPILKGYAFLHQGLRFWRLEIGYAFQVMLSRTKGYAFQLSFF
ncbi:hypothetical protein Ahy_A07g035575 isoform A [Arachis hypogaea]|uniref:Uncharacterized protein n=1 Tax=Arachis hypogaea TaxID=3818 RepID=A0A445CE86_ARAHY|nr:hypothetical protein Ahy_A07g035575 isoform A [Arachis hypogaea]